MNLIYDVRYAFRALRKNPVFALAGLLVLALGIGANTAIFTVVDAALLRPLPFGEPNRLMRLWHTPPEKSFPGMSVFALSAANFLDWKQQSHSFQNLAIYTGQGMILTRHGEPESAFAARVSYDFFPTLEVQPLLGRTFRVDEDQVGYEREIILSYPYWKSRFGGDTTIVGRTVTFNDQPYTIIGVMPKSFALPSWAKMWIPMAFTDTERVVRGEHHYSAIGRLKPGVTAREAQSEMDTISSRLAQQYPADDNGWGAKVLPLRDDTVSDVKPTLLVLLGAVAFVLLIACANVANLFLARMLTRKKEIAIRAALGARRSRLVLQSLSETVLLALFGGACGMGIAVLGVALLRKFFGSNLPATIQVRLDLRVLFFTLVASLLTGVLAGLLPAWRLVNTDLHEALKQGLGRGGSDSGGMRMRSFLVIAEVALSLMLLVGAGLMIRTLWVLHGVDPGFDAKGVVTMSLQVPSKKFAGPAAEIAAMEETLRRVQAVAGVETAAAVDSIPLAGGGSTQPIAIEGNPVAAMADQPEVGVRLVSAGYARALHIHLLQGRDFTDADGRVSSSVGPILISAAMAKHFWPNENPIGRRLTLTFTPTIVRQIVGVVADVRGDALNHDPQDMIYTPLAQLSEPSTGDWHSFGLSLVVRTKTNPDAAAPAIVGAVHGYDPSEPVTDIRTLADIVDQSLSQQRFTMMLLAAFAALALLLAGIGIYSVLAYSVGRRIREIGIRMALGAQVHDVLRLVVTDGLKPVLTGVVLGSFAALALSPVLAALVYGVSTRDFPTFGLVCVLLIVVALVACVAPTVRATRVEPVHILRDE
jgi:predicted permease